MSAPIAPGGLHPKDAVKAKVKSPKAKAREERVVARKEVSEIRLGLDLARRPKSTMAFPGRMFARRRICVSTTRLGRARKLKARRVMTISITSKRML